MDLKNGKWSKGIIDLQHDDGTWGLLFHSLAYPISKRPLTTEQALRRLQILDFDIHDAPIRKTVDYMISCLRGERKMDDYWEKTHNWELFTQLMLSAWVKIFEPNNELALAFARRWAEVIEEAFAKGRYNHDDYIQAYIAQFASKPRGAREIDFVDFYHISLLQGVLRPETESSLLDYIITKPNGMYYVYGKSLDKLPEVFTSKEASHYLTALEILAAYNSAAEKLGFAVDWVYANQDIHGQWDFGAQANDGIYFPLSDSWTKVEVRKADCTRRVTAFLQRLGVRRE